MQRNSIFTVCVSSLLLLLSGCSSYQPYKDLENYFNHVQMQQAQYKSKLKANDIKIPTGTLYNGNLNRSPFLGATQEKTSLDAKSGNPLQAYSLNVLRLLGTVTENEITAAYVSTPDSMVYRIRVGDMIGDHHGKVINVQPGSVNVMELDSDNPGEQVQRVVALKLRNES